MYHVTTVTNHSIWYINKVKHNRNVIMSFCTVSENLYLSVAV